MAHGLGTAVSHLHVGDMSNRASRQRRKAAMAAIPKITCQELIDLGLMNAEGEFPVPKCLKDRARDMSLMEMISEAMQRRAAWLAGLLKAAHELPR